MTPDPIFVELARLRQARGWSRRELARRAGVNDVTIGYAESGRRSPTVAVTTRLAGAFALRLALAPVVRGRELRPCGTAAAAKRHREHGEPLCDDCRAAERTESRERKRARRAPRPGVVDPTAPTVSTTPTEPVKHPYADDGYGYCTRCALPRANAIHSLSSSTGGTSFD